MIPLHRMNRRAALRGMLGGTAVTVGLPFLDCWLNENGTALAATGAPLPTRFGTWFHGLAFTPGFWEPKTEGRGYEFGPHLQVLSPYRGKINIFSGLTAYADGKGSLVHSCQNIVMSARMIDAVGVDRGAGTIDTLIGDVIGTRTRFRSLEVSCDGTPDSLSRRTGGARNPSEVSPAALYTRVFGPEFIDPNAADFKPDPAILARRSVLSAVTEQRQDLLRDAGTTDRAKLDEYFTSLRSLENQLDQLLQKPEPLKACIVPSKDADPIDNDATVIDNAIAKHNLFAKIFAHAIACDQTRIFNLHLSAGLSRLRRAGSSDTFHTRTHEEAVDQKLGYQPDVVWFQKRTAETLFAMIKSLDDVKEGDGSLLDHLTMLYVTDQGLARTHSPINVPVMTIGGANGRLKTGYHFAAKADPASRPGLTVMQAFGLPMSAWCTESNTAKAPFSEILI